jgi:ParB/RepB/Spo0J family partition protein
MAAAPKHFAAAIGDLKPSPLNPRKTIDEEELGELAESIRQKGVLQSLLVRPASKGKGYEIICGERRWRASKIAKVATLPVVCRHDLDDEAALEAMVIENSQRADVHPLEEADGIAALRDRGKTIEEIAAKLGRPPAFCHRRLVLLQLGSKARKAFATGGLTYGAAEVIATIPAKLQDEALRNDLHQDEPLSRSRARWIANRYRCELAGAAWSIDDAELVPKAGACSKCPKRTGAQPELFEGEGKDRCTDPTCFAEKKLAHGRKRLAEAKSAGHELLSKEECKKLWHYAHSRVSDHGSVFIDLDETTGPYGEGKKWRNAIGKKRMPASIVIAVNPHTDAIHELLRRADVKKLLASDPQKGDPDPSSSGPRRSSSGLPPAEKKKIAIGKAKGKAHKIAVDRLREKLAQPLTGKLDDLLELLVEGVLERIHGVGVLERCASRRGWIADPKKYDGGQYEAAREIMRGAAAGGAERAIPVLVELIAEEHVRSLGTTYDHVEETGFVSRVMGFLGVDWLAIEQEEIARVEERLAKKKGAKGSKKKGPKKGKKTIADDIAAYERGVCRTCGCTHDSPCEGGCAWTDDSETLCTACVEEGDES